MLLLTFSKRIISERILIYLTFVILSVFFLLNIVTSPLFLLAQDTCYFLDVGKTAEGRIYLLSKGSFLIIIEDYRRIRTMFS